MARKRYKPEEIVAGAVRACARVMGSYVGVEQYARARASWGLTPN
jgi:hypothetical protein